MLSDNNRESGAPLRIPLALDLLELGYTFPSITDETGITIEDAEAVHTGPFETCSPREQCVSGCRRSEEVGHQGGGLSGIGSIRLPKLGAHPLLLHAELDPEHEEDEDENDEPAHLGDCNRHAKKPGQNAGVDWVTDHGIRTGDIIF
jgi:hypothetical protein